MHGGWVRLLAVGIVAPLLAGCLGDDALEPAGNADARSREPGEGIDKSLLSKEQFGILPRAIEYVAASLDDIALYTEVYLPDGEGPWPTILVSSPYHLLAGNGLIDDIIGVDPYVTFYVPRGYAVVLADVRGTGNSEGCMDMMGAKEQQDQYDLVEWTAAQDWSDGKVAMTGGSYVGTTPHEAAILAPPHLTTIVTIAGVTNQWRNTYQNGVPYAGRYYPLLYEGLVGIPPPTNVERGPAWAANVAAGACEQEEAIAHVQPGVYEMGVYDAYWAERNLTSRVGNVRVPVFYNEGFADRAVNPMESIFWFNELPSPKKAFFHQGGHQAPPRDDYQDTELAWFDHFLKGIENGIVDTPIVEVLTNTDEIRVDDEWPPRDAVPTRFYLAPGALATSVPDAGEETYLADMARSAAAAEYLLGPPGAPVDDVIDQAIEGAAGLPTSLSFVSEPLTADLHVAGLPWFNLVSSVEAPNTYFMTYLFDVEGDAWTQLSEGWFNAHLHEGFDKSSPLTPGEIYTFRFRFEPREHVFEAGHSIGVRILGHDPDVLPFDEGVTRNTVYYGGEAPTYVELPVLDAPTLHARPSGV